MGFGAISGAGGGGGGYDFSSKDQDQLNSGGSFLGRGSNLVGVGNTGGFILPILAIGLTILAVKKWGK